MIAFETMSAGAKVEMLSDVMNRVKNILATIMVDTEKLHILDIAENSPYTRISLDIGPEPAFRARSQSRSGAARGQLR